MTCRTTRRFIINATETSGGFTVSASVTDDAGHVFTSNQAVVHVVRIEADQEEYGIYGQCKAYNLWTRGTCGGRIEDRILHR